MIDVPESTVVHVLSSVHTRWVQQEVNGEVSKHLGEREGRERGERGGREGDEEAGC